MVWSMKRKKNPIGDITKYKSILCYGGHIAIEIIYYWNTYSPVMYWIIVIVIICMDILMDWHMQSINSVIDFL